jgi:hypothetical protein
VVQQLIGETLLQISCTWQDAQQSIQLEIAIDQPTGVDGVRINLASTLVQGAMFPVMVVRAAMLRDPAFS